MTGRPDNTAVAALDAPYIKPAFLAYLDIVDAQSHYTTWPANLSFAEDYPDEDMAGATFLALKADFIDVSEIKFQEGGSESVTARMSGLILPDNDLLNILNDVTKWRGRDARFWQAIYNANNVRQGAFWNYYTGYMVGLSIMGDPGQQMIELTIEGYLASLASPSNRTLLDQSDFDPGDLSADAAIAIANGTSGNGLYGTGGGGGYGGAGMGLGDYARNYAGHMWQ